MTLPAQHPSRCNSEELIPHEVIEATVLNGVTPIKAWREHLRLTQSDIARRLGISQPAYAKQENSVRLRPATLAGIARALGLSPAQLDFEVMAALAPRL